jgi:hypothetical protein
VALFALPTARCGELLAIDMRMAGALAVILAPLPLTTGRLAGAATAAGAGRVEKASEVSPAKPKSPQSVESSAGGVTERDSGAATAPAALPSLTADGMPPWSSRRTNRRLTYLSRTHFSTVEVLDD